MHLLSVLALLFVSQTASSLYRRAFDTREDVSGAIQCLSTGYNVGIFRVIKNGTFDQVGWKNYQAARSIIYDCYLELIVELDGKGSADDQFNTFWNKVGQSVQWPSLWIDLTGPKTNWNTNITKNYELVETFLGKATKKGAAVGVFVNSKTTRIVGNQTLEPYIRVWYQGNEKMDMGDYFQFGGQPRASLKQYSSNTTDCGVQINKNIYDAPYKKAVEFNQCFAKKLTGRKNNHH
ncbi:hypothetical protein M3Y97_00018300 [Aphelenchoides bicaudatus]|nr:hypothetical protein M3Y97_00018300 [Aphelenchoides bicaudatus]